MNLKNLLWSILILFICSCNTSDPDPITSEPEEIKVQFTVLLNQKTLPFPSSKSMPPLDIPEPRTKQSEDDQEITDICTKIEYIVYEADNLNTIFKQNSFKLGVDDDFGIIYDALPEGAYHIVIVAHSSEETSIEKHIMDFNRISDTFHRTHEIDISGTDPVNTTITLQRVVSKIQFKSTEAVPDNQKTFSIEVDDFPGKLDLLTGHGSISDELFQYSHSFTTTERGKENTTHDFLCFDPADNATMEAALTSTNTNDDITCTWDVTIDPRANQMISYSGRLYSFDANNDNTFQLEIEDGGKWGETIPKELE